MIWLTLFFLVIVIIELIAGNEPFAIIPFCVTLALSVYSIFDHIDDISKIRMGDEYIKAQQDSIDELDRQMKDLSISIPNSALFNADSPYKSLIDLKGERINQLTKTKLKILDSKNSLLKRKLGINRSMVTWFGDK